MYLEDMCPIPSTFVLWDCHHRDDVGPYEPRYIHKLIIYNELCHATSNKIIGDDDVVIVENLEKHDDDKKVVVDMKVVHDKNVVDGVEVEDDNPQIDYWGNIDLGQD